MTNQAVTLTIICNITANYGEGLGNISSVQKVYRNGKMYASRSRESMKNALMVQSGMYDDLVVTVDAATQKKVDESLNAANCRALEGGYMNTSGTTVIRKSSFYLTDAIACEPFVNDVRFHNNLYFAANYAKAHDINLQDKKNAKECGLMIYQYEYDKSMKKYSLTIDLDKVGKDENFKTEASAEEKAARVNAILEAVENLSLVVKGNMDNSEPLFLAGGIGDKKTHYFENVVEAKKATLNISTELKNRLVNGYKCALLGGDNFINEAEIITELQPESVGEFFAGLRKQVNEYYGV